MMTLVVSPTNTNQSTSLPPLTQLLPINHFLLWPIVAFWHTLIGNKFNYHLKIVSNVQLLSGQWCEIDYIYIYLSPGHFDYIPLRSNWNSYMGDFLESFVWSSMDHSKDNFKNNYLIFKPNYFISFFINFFFLINFHNNYLPPFLIITSIF